MHVKSFHLEAVNPWFQESTSLPPSPDKLWLVCAALLASIAEMGNMRLQSGQLQVQLESACICAALQLRLHCSLLRYSLKLSVKAALNGRCNATSAGCNLLVHPALHQAQCQTWCCVHIADEQGSPKQTLPQPVKLCSIPAGMNTVNLHAFTKGSQLIHCLSQLHHRLIGMLHMAFTASEALMTASHWLHM